MVGEIVEIVFYLSASALCIFAIYYLGKINASVLKMQEDVSQIADRVPPLIDSLEETGSSIKELSDQTRLQLEKTGWIIDEVKSRVEGILQFETKVRSQIDSANDIPLVQNLSAFRKGFLAFWNKITDKS